VISVIYSDKFLEHDTGGWHPESPERLTAIVNSLKNSGYSAQLEWAAPLPATEEELEWVHTRDHIEYVRQVALRGGGFLDGDTPVSAGSYDIALLSAGAWMMGVDIVLEKKQSAFVVSRPPGHHAERERGMGFCLFNNCALAVKYALQSEGINRVAVFDWDVHHGNGTQQILDLDERTAYCSIHQSRFYPGTGAREDCGPFNNVLNIPMPAGSDGDDYINLFEKEIGPFFNKFNPDMLIISAGFDACINDQLAGMNVETGDFGKLTNLCREIFPNLLVGLEGGYDLESLGSASVAVVKELLKK
jgi:acetoin utilization deacetylase AcuC-like enzyme